MELGDRIAYSIKNKTVQYYIVDYNTFTRKQKDDCLRQLTLIINLGADFESQERHMKLNGYDCRLEDIY